MSQIHIGLDFPSVQDAKKKKKINLGKTFPHTFEQILDSISKRKYTFRSSFKVSIIRSLISAVPQEHTLEISEFIVLPMEKRKKQENKTKEYYVV